MSSVSPSGESQAQAVIKQILGSSQTTTPIASAQGKISTGIADSPVTAQILLIKRSSQSTTVVWRLKSTSGAKVPTNSFQLSGHAPLFDTRGLALVDVAAKKSLYPYTYVPIVQPADLDTGCLCSDVPDSVDGSGVVLYAMMPALPAGVDTVDVSIPGFSTMKSVKVAS